MTTRDTFLPYHQPLLGAEEEASVLETMRSGWLTTGPKTKAFEQFLQAIKVDKSALIALPFDQDASLNARLSGRNVDSVTMVAPDQLTAFSMLNHRFVVIGKSELEAWLKGPGSQTGKAAKVSPMGRKVEEASK